jgi:glutaredoxin
VKSLYYLRSTSLVAKKDLSSPRAKIISKADCPYCTKLKAQLKADGIAYHEIDRSVVEEFPYATVPQLWIDGKHIGGYIEYMNEFHAKSEPSQTNECAACEG